MYSDAELFFEKSVESQEFQLPTATELARDEGIFVSRSAISGLDWIDWVQCGNLVRRKQWNQEKTALERNNRIS